MFWLPISNIIVEVHERKRRCRVAMLATQIVGFLAGWYFVFLILARAT